MASVTLYSFEDADGNEFGTFTTFDVTVAREYARTNRMRLIAQEYEYTDSELVEDFT